MYANTAENMSRLIALLATWVVLGTTGLTTFVAQMDFTDITSLAIGSPFAVMALVSARIFWTTLRNVREAAREEIKAKDETIKRLVVRVEGLEKVLLTQIEKLRCEEEDLT